MAVLSRILILTAIALVPLPALGAGEAGCERRVGDKTSCYPLAVCFGERYEPMWGRAVGWQEGVFSVRGKADFACEGTWSVLSGAFRVAAEIACTDGATGTAEVDVSVMKMSKYSRAKLADGRSFILITGQLAQDTIEHRNPSIGATVQCIKYKHLIRLALEHAQKYPPALEDLE